MWQQTDRIVSYILAAHPFTPKAGIILGTGLGGLAREIDPAVILPYHTIPGFPLTTVHGHEGKLILGEFGNTMVMAFQGRFHFYEGYSMQQVILPVKIMHRLGIKLLILSNASGGLNPDFEIGDRMIVTDHINLMGENPLIGLYGNRLDERYTDLSEVYDPKWVRYATELASRLYIPIRRGVLAAVTGPCFETRAEYAYIRSLGADAVGMSIIPEALAAKQFRMQVFALSVISDLGIPGKIVEVTHEEVQRAAGRSEPGVTRLVKGLVNEMVKDTH
jgi:purine-nucleoside phosphorylase